MPHTQKHKPKRGRHFRSTYHKLHLKHTYFPVTRDGKHGLFSTNDLHGIQLGETLAEPGDFDLVALHPSQLATMIVSPSKYGEGVS